MSDQPWLGDACSLVDAFRAGELSPLEALDASLGAIEHSQLNAFCHVDPERSRRWAQEADVSLPFGGVPVGVRGIAGGGEGWPDRRGSPAFRGQVSVRASTQVTRLRAAGAGLACAPQRTGFRVRV